MLNSIKITLNLSQLLLKPWDRIVISLINPALCLRQLCIQLLHLMLNQRPTSLELLLVESLLLLRILRLLKLIL